MKRRFDIRQYPFLLAAAALVLYVLSTFVFGGGGLTAVGVIAGLLLTVALAAAVYFTAEFFSLGINHAAPLLFLILTLSFPSVALWDKSLLCAIPVSAAFYISVRFHGGQVSGDLAFFYNVLLGIASLMFPPLVWAALFLLAMNFAMAADKARFVVMSIVGLLLPPVCYLAYMYVAADARALAPAAKAWFKVLASPAPSLGASSAARVVKVLIFAIIFIVALVRFFRRSAEYSVSHSHVMILIFSYTAMTALLLVLFPFAGLALNTMLVTVPLSLVFYDYLVWGASDRECRIALAFGALAVLLEYAFLAVK